VSTKARWTVRLRHASAKDGGALLQADIIAGGRCIGAATIRPGELDAEANAQLMARAPGLLAENAALHAQLDGEEARWATLTRKYVAAVTLDRENLRVRLRRALPAEGDAINAVFGDYEAEYPVAPPKGEATDLTQGGVPC
jgi:hypothetical protein